MTFSGFGRAHLSTVILPKPGGCGASVHIQRYGPGHGKRLVHSRLSSNQSGRDLTGVSRTWTIEYSVDKVTVWYIDEEHNSEIGLMKISKKTTWISDGLYVVAGPVVLPGATASSDDVAQYDSITISGCQKG